MLFSVNTEFLSGLELEINQDWLVSEFIYAPFPPPMHWDYKYDTILASVCKS